MSINYRERLIKIVVELDNFMDDLNLNIVNLAMSGEFSEIDRMFEEGDVMNLDITDFENINDQNVQKLIKLLDYLFELNNSLRNINAISAKETDSDDDLSF